MKKILLIFTAALLSIGNVFAEQTWNGTSSTAWTKGTGTASDPYLIESPAHLKYLSTRVNAGNTYSGKYFKQTQDFNINSKTWTSIGTSTNKFAGIYDGGGKYISNFKSPIFGYVNNATIKNLTMQGTLISIGSTSQQFGALILDAAGTCSITNCHYKGVATRSQNYGYISGFVYNVASGTLTMTRCSNTGTSPDAGFIFKCTTGAKCVLRECYYKAGTVSYFGYPFIYGGTSSDSNVNGTVTIERCAFIMETTNNNTYLLVNPSGGSRSSISFKDCYFRIKGGSGSRNIQISEYGGYNHCYFVDNTAKVSNINFYAGGNNNFATTINKDCIGITKRTAVQMKTKVFLEELNQYSDYFTMDYEGINDGYPILKWQAGTRYNVTATCDANRGSVSGGGEFPNGYVATLTATPKSGCTFIGWSDGNTDNPRSVTVNGEATYTAQFTKSSYTIYVNQDCTSNIE